MIHGEDLILAINGTPLAASKSCSLSKKQSFIDVSNPTDGRWEACVPKTLSWSMSSDCLLATMDAYKTLDAAWKAGTPLTIRFFNTEYDENDFRDEINVTLELASIFANSNGLSHIYGVKRYYYGQEYVDYLEPITTIDYLKSDNTTEARRPEVDLLNRLASYYGASRQTLDIITKHPVVNNAAAVLPLLKLNGIGDNKTYLPLSERRDWRTNECTLTCFEIPEQPSES